MATFECTVCGEKIKQNVENCCAQGAICKQKDIYHCGKPMMEVMD